MQACVAGSELSCQFYFFLALLGKWGTWSGAGGKQTYFLLSSSVLAKFQDNPCQIFPENLDPYAGLTNLSWCADVTVTACQLTRMFSFSDWVTKTTAPLDSLEPIHLNEYNKPFCHSLHFSRHFHLSHCLGVVAGSWLVTYTVSLFSETPKNTVADAAVLVV